MFYHVAKALFIGSVLGGLCLPVQANSTNVAEPVATTASVAPSTSTPDAPLQFGPVTGAVSIPTTEILPLKPLVRMSLLLPLQSDALRQPAEALRAGFLAAFERDQAGIEVNVVETSDAPQDVLSAYNKAAAQSDIVIGPLSRSGVTALAQSGNISKPTIALTQPDAEVEAPPKMLLMGLSVEDEAKQAAIWAGKDKSKTKAFVLATSAAWQQRAAKAFAAEWQRMGREQEMVEINAPGGYLNGRSLLELKKRIQSDKSTLLFAALDADQAMHVRAIVGSQIPLYGTSQLNPFALSERRAEEPAIAMDGTRLLDIPWQLQPDHPAVMIYPRPVVSADQKRSADLERLYALGIDAFRVGREIAYDHTNFQLDGVTGKLTVRFGQKTAFFERSTPHAVYRDGGVVAATQ
ncbi:penicillin-binding protein activator [Noviherbaspirillum massiliense]|uniref:penicillin-binding protein activator n=1 Tax=Noviherbaspirillum massiliense TaxID=1465823 RepID=UPI0002DEFFA4|nr:penicillin-binding protein activator [Noviherbaspirillum massiliense]